MHHLECATAREEGCTCDLILYGAEFLAETFGERYDSDTWEFCNWR